MTAIRVIFDGKSFVPQEPVSLPDRSEAVVLFDGCDPAAKGNLDQAVREYYQGPDDSEDAVWSKATTPESSRAWDED